MKNNKGITLMALAITIGILLILVGVAMGTVTKKNGIIKQAETSSALAEKESIIEKIEADLYNEKVKLNRKPTKEEMKELIEKKNYATSVDENSFVSKNGNYEINYNEILGWEDL